MGRDVEDLLCGSRSLHFHCKFCRSQEHAQKPEAQTQRELYRTRSVWKNARKMRLTSQFQKFSPSKRIRNRETFLQAVSAKYVVILRRKDTDQPAVA